MACSVEVNLRLHAAAQSFDFQNRKTVEVQVQVAHLEFDGQPAEKGIGRMDSLRKTRG
jgi:hypothetical protein